jgi:hypothetical protein
MSKKAEIKIQPPVTEYIMLGDLPKEFNDELMRYFSAYSVAIARARNESAKEFNPLGSGVLVQKGNRFGILTAKHCLHACTPSVKLGMGGCDTLMLIINRGRGVLIRPQEAVEHDLVVSKTEQFGPDLTFIEILPGKCLSTIQAVSSFWSLDKNINDLIKEYGIVGTPIVTVGFPSLDYKTIITGNNIHHHVRHMTFSNVIQSGDVIEHNGWDYVESNIWYGGTPDLPLTFAGVSGGPVWGMQIRKHKSDGHLSIEKSALIGITFYQTEMKGDERRLRAHFIKSIYDTAWRNLK